MYRKVFELQPKNVYAVNSIAYCVKFVAASGTVELPDDLFDQLKELYLKGLAIDPEDIETNFNLGLLYVQFNQDTAMALEAFQKCVARDDIDKEGQELFRAQFAKAYFNIGIIHDKDGEYALAAQNYKLCMETCENDPKRQLSKSATYKKSGSNYAVCQEKLSKREEAVLTLESLRDNFGNEIRLANNIGIIQKRMDQPEKAIESYKAALKLDKNSFFPNYNMGVLICQDLEKMDEALGYFNKALKQAQMA